MNLDTNKKKMVTNKQIGYLINKWTSSQIINNHHQIWSTKLKTGYHSSKMVSKIIFWNRQIWLTK